MRILYVTTIGTTMIFFKSLIQELIALGHTVDLATNEEYGKVPDFYKELGCKIFHISTSRSIFSLGNLKAITQIKKIAANYDIIHCHTPLAGIAARFACKSLRKKKRIQVFYTAHGFHFYKGAPIKNWVIYYPIEKLCSKWTDKLITINSEDYNFAKKRMKAKQILFVPGVGVDSTKFNRNNYSNSEIELFRKEIGVTEEEKMLLSVGELSKRKNHLHVIKALSYFKDYSWKYYIVGSGKLHDKLAKTILKLDLKNKVLLLGQRNDVVKLCTASDLFIFPSLQEGLPVALMEAMFLKTPIFCSNIRGNTDLIKSNSFLFDTKDVFQLKNLLFAFFNKQISFDIENNFDRVKSFDIKAVNDIMIKLYN